MFSHEYFSNSYRFDRLLVLQRSQRSKLLRIIVQQPVVGEPELLVFLLFAAVFVVTGALATSFMFTRHDDFQVKDFLDQ